MWILSIIGWADTPRTDEAIRGGIDWHLQSHRQAIWTGVERRPFLAGTRVVAKIAGAKVIALTGQLTSTRPRTDDPIERNGHLLPYRYDVRWDARPPVWIPVEDLGSPFSDLTRSTRSISRDDFIRAYLALHGADPPRDMDGDSPIAVRERQRARDRSA